VQEPIRVAVIHGGRLIRDGMAELLGHEAAVRMVGTFASAREARAALADGGDRVVLYDLDTAHQDGAAEVMSLREQPGGRILFFNVADDDAAIIECIQTGASGCVLQDASIQDLVAAIRSVGNGAPPLSPRVITTLFRYVAGLTAGTAVPGPEKLTTREQEILALITEGLSNKEIAERLVLQPQTVKNYVHLVMQKLGVRSRFAFMRSMRTRKRP
jgi:two-component system response regulator DevR